MIIISQVGDSEVTNVVKLFFIEYIHAVASDVTFFDRWDFIHHRLFFLTLLVFAQTYLKTLLTNMFCITNYKE